MAMIPKDYLTVLVALTLFDCEFRVHQISSSTLSLMYVSSFFPIDFKQIYETILMLLILTLGIFFLPFEPQVVSSVAK